MERETAMMGCMWALWAWWIWCQITTAAVESHRVSQLAVRREASLKKSILNFHRFGCSRCNLERGTILIWNKNNNARL
jgi:hypothetical protein